MNHRTAIAGCLVVGIAGADALAQEQTRQNTERRTGDPQIARFDESRLDDYSNMLRASTLLGSDVTTRQGNGIGEIDDIIMDTRTGDIAFVVIGVDENLGLTDQQCPVPWSTLYYDHGQNRFETSLSAARLKEGPKLSGDDSLRNVDLEEIYDRHGAWPYWHRSRQQQGSGQGDATQQASGQQATNQQSRSQPAGQQDNRDQRDRRTDARQQAAFRAPTAAQLQRISKLEGMNVVNRTNEELGEVEDVVINVMRGQAAYVVLASGGFLGINEDHFAIPARSLDIRQQDGKQVLAMNVTRDSLQKADGFTANVWPNMADPYWQRSNDRAFGYEEPMSVYTERYVFTDAQQRSELQERERSYQQDFEAGTETRVVGRVTSISQQDPTGMVTLALATDAGGSARVLVAPSWYLNEQERQIERGDEVTIIGVQRRERSTDRPDDARPTGDRQDRREQERQERIAQDRGDVIIAREIAFRDGTLVLRDRQGSARWDAWQTSSAEAKATTPAQ